VSSKTIAYISLLVVALLLLATGGWLVNGVKAFARQTRHPQLRPRYA
jgi:type III secretory pathway component EscS